MQKPYLDVHDPNPSPIKGKSPLPSIGDIRGEG